MKKTIVIVGPTAVGKTKISVLVAKHFNAPIISGDSVAIYKELNIGSAKPTELEMDGVKHYLIDILDAGEAYSAFDFQKEARAIMDREPLTVIAGGTGLYIQSALYNYTFNGEKRSDETEIKYSHLSNDELYALLLSLNSDIDKEKLHPNNRKRVLRAIELASNHSVNNQKKELLYDPYIIYLSLDREILYDRINKRVDEMINEGLEREVKALYLKGIKPNAIGYQEFIPYFEGYSSLDVVIDEIKKNTRHLAKRQETWFRNQMNSHFYTVNLENINETADCIINDVEKWMVE